LFVHDQDSSSRQGSAILYEVCAIDDISLFKAMKCNTLENQGERQERKKKQSEQMEHRLALETKCGTKKEFLLQLMSPTFRLTAL